MTNKSSSSEQLQLKTLYHYKTHATSLIENTQTLNHTEWCQPFITLLSPHAHILDAGCGAGYASQYFLQQGFVVTAFDASEPLVQFASQLIQQPVHHLKYEEIAFENQFDGIWACASLLHVPRLHMTQVVHKLAVALKDNGILYANFVCGEKETSRGGILFNDYTETQFSAVLYAEPLLRSLRMWKSPDLPPARPDREWLHILARKTGSANT
ncbi:MAG: class I SAM-dependent methyltransferase [Anaerolineales bacterium]